MSLGIVIMALCVVIPIALAVYNIGHNEGKARKRIMIVTAVFAAVFCTAFIAAAVEEVLAEKDRQEYHVESDGLFNSLTYEGDADGYHVFYKSGFISDGTYYAVPDSSELPPIIGVWKQVTLLTPKDSDGGWLGNVKAGDRYCELMSENTVIKGNYITFELLTMVFSFGGFAIYEIIRAIVTFVRSRQK